MDNYLDERNCVYSRYEHCELAHAGLDLTLPLDGDINYHKSLVEDLVASGWIIRDTYKTFLHFPDDDSDGSSACQEEPNILLCRFEHYSIANATVEVTLPLYAKTQDVLRSLIGIESNGWVCVATEEIVLPLPDDEDVADSKTLH